MRTTTIISAAAAAAFLITGPVLSAGPASEEVYRKMAADFSRSLTAKNIKTVAMLGFTRRARATAEESEYAAEKLTEHLSRAGKASVFERSRVEALLREQRLGHSGAAKEEGKPGGLSSVEAVITGTIFGTGEKLKIVARLVNPRSGEILHALEGETDRNWELLPEVMQFLVPMPDIERLDMDFRDIAVYPGTFRDAPGPDTRAGSGCSGIYARLHARQAGLLKEKARNWAIKMRSPGFSKARLTRNPGAEIADPGLRKLFYESLKEYHRSYALEPLSALERSRVEELAEEEKRAADECGLR